MNILKSILSVLVILHAVFAFLQNCFLVFVLSKYGNRSSDFVFIDKENSYFVFFVVFILLRSTASIATISGVIKTQVWLLQISLFFTTSYLTIMIWLMHKGKRRPNYISCIDSTSETYCDFNRAEYLILLVLGLCDLEFRDYYRCSIFVSSLF